MDSKATKRMGSVGAILAGLNNRSSGQDMNLEGNVKLKETDVEEEIFGEEETSLSSKNEPVQIDGANLKSQQNKTCSFENASSDDQSLHCTDATSEELPSVNQVDPCEKGQRKASNSVGAMLAGLANRKAQMSEGSEPAQTSGLRCDEGSQALPDPTDGNREEIEDTSAAACNANPKRKRAKENEQKNSNKRNTYDVNNSAKPVPKKAASGLGAIMASLGNRQSQMSEDPKPFPSPGNRKDPETNNWKGSTIGKEEKSDEGKAITSSESNDNASSRTHSIEDDDGEDKNLEAKKKHSLGSILAGLASRQQEFSSSTKHPEEGKGEKKVSDHNPKADTSKGHKLGISSEEGTTALPNENRSKLYKKDFRKDDGEDVDVEVKRNRSLGSVLAGLAGRQHEITGNKRQTFSSGWGSNRERYQNKKSRKEYDEGEGDDYEGGQERYNEEPVVREEDNVIFVRGHKPKRKPTGIDIENEKKAQANNMTFEEEAELRKTHSIGAMLANLANRTFPDPPPTSNDYGRRDRSWGSSYDTDSQGSGRGSRKRTYSEEEDYEYNQRRGRHDSKDRQRREEWEENKSKKKKKDEFDPVKAAEEMKAESERLEKLLGKGVITVGFTENRVMAYICEICQVQLTNKMNLEAHVDGMQHLRKKNLWDKRKRIAESEPSQYKGGRSGWVKVDKDEQESASAKSASGKPKQFSSFPTQSARYGGGDSSCGYDGYENYDSSYGQEGYDYSGQYFMQPPPYGVEGYMNMGGHMMGGYGQVPMNTGVDGGKSSNNWVTSQINTAAPPPPPPPVGEEPSKPKNAQGGATGSLLQRLDACAVKNAKDEELAFSVISALLKSLKEFNHKRGDTKLIEILTEIDIKFRCLKRPLSSGNLSHENRAATKYQTSAQQSPSTVPYSNINLSGSSASAQYSLSSNTASGTWYTLAGSQSQGVAPRTSASEAVTTSYASKETQESTMILQDASSLTVSGYSSQGASSAKSTVSTGYASQTVTKGTVPSVPSYPQQGLNTSSYSGHGTDGTSSYPGLMNYYSTGYTSFGASNSKQANSADHISQGKTGAKDTGYHTQGSTSAFTSYQGYSSKAGNSSVMEIIRSSNEPPPPPPPEKGAANYSAQGYQTQMPPVCFRMTAPPPPYNSQN